MGKFGWAYVDCNIDCGQAAGPTGSLQYLTGTNRTSGSARLLYHTAAYSNFQASTMILTGTLIVTGTISASHFHIQDVTRIDATGSTFFGDTADDRHVRTGSLSMSGSTSEGNAVPVLYASAGSSKQVGVRAKPSVMSTTTHALIVSGTMSASAEISASHFYGSARGLTGIPIGALPDPFIRAQITGTAGVSGAIGQYAALSASILRVSGDSYLSGNSYLGINDTDIVTVAGRLTASEGAHLNSADSRLTIGNNLATAVYMTADSIINQNGHWNIDQQDASKDIRIHMGEDAGATGLKLKNNSGTTRFVVSSTGQVSGAAQATFTGKTTLGAVLQVSGNILAAGHISPTVNNSKDLGSAVKKWANVYSTTVHASAIVGASPLSISSSHTSFTGSVSFSGSTIRFIESGSTGSGSICVSGSGGTTHISGGHIIITGSSPALTITAGDLIVSGNSYLGDAATDVAAVTAQLTASQGGYFAGRVGIGTNSPETFLHIRSGSGGTIPAIGGSLLVLESSEKPKIHFQSAGAYGGSIVFASPTDNDEGQIDYDNGSNRFLFKTGGNTKMAILGDNVGIGTTSPTVKLDVAGALTVSGNAILGDASTDVTVNTGEFTASTNTRMGSLTSHRHQVTGTLGVYRAGGGTQNTILKVDVDNYQVEVLGFVGGYHLIDNTPYTASLGNYILGISASQANGTGDQAMNIRLLGASAVGAGAMLVLKDQVTQRSLTSKIYVSAAAGQTIDGQPYYLMTGSMPSISLYSNGSNAWFIY